MRTGDAAFDARFHVQGSVPDVVRALLARDAARAGLVELFERGGRLFAVDADGAVLVFVERKESEALEARQHAIFVADLVDVLEENAEAPPLALVERGAQAATGGASGAPVVIPVVVPPPRSR